MTIKTLGMGAIRSNVFSKIAKSKKKTPGEEHFDTVYKLDKTGKKDKMIKALNKKIRSNIKQQAGFKDIEEYNRIMTKGSKYSPKFFKDK